MADSPPWYRRKGWRRAGVAALLVLNVAATALGFIAALKAGDPDTTHARRWLIAGVAAVSFPLITASVRDAIKGKTIRELDEELDYSNGRLVMAMGRCIRPCLLYLGQITRATRAGDRRRLLGKLQQAVVNAAAELCGPEGTRAVYFQADAGRMTWEAYSGNSEPSRRVFRDDAQQDEAGYAAFENVRAKQVALYQDLSVESPPGFTPSETTNYETFISGSVFAGDAVYGMLNVNAPAANDLGESDMEVVKVLATLLGAAHAAADR